MRSIKFIALNSPTIAIILVLILWFIARPVDVLPPIEGLRYPPTIMLPEFSLVDQLQQPFTLARLRGKWSLITLGYTNCDCPTTLTQIKAFKSYVHQKLHAFEDLNYIFISLDGQNDTPSVLNSYLSQIDKNFIGVSGTKTALQPLLNALEISDVLPPPAEASQTFSEVFLIDPHLRLVSVFTTQQLQNPAKFLVDYASIRQFFSGKLFIY
jgi:protein SCO1/2